MPPPPASPFKPLIIIGLLILGFSWYGDGIHPERTMQRVFGMPSVQDSLAAAAPARCTLRAAGALPDPTCDEGATDLGIEDGYTDEICPSAKPLAPLRINDTRRANTLADYGIEAAQRERYRVVPVIRAELGGLADEDNLYPIRRDLASRHAATAQTLRGRVCAGDLSLDRAREIVVTDWRKVTP